MEGEGEEGPGGGVRRRLSEFRVALSKYEHLAGVTVDRGVALRVEEAELTVEESLLPTAREAVAAGLDFRGFLERLEATGELARLAGVVASTLGYKGEPVDVGEALARLAGGGEAGEGERLAFTLVQGVARAYARAYEEARGRVESASGECPVCGGLSDVMVRRGDGYYMICPFCFYEWRVSASLACPYCGSSDEFALGVFTDSTRRAALAHCQRCGSTWRVILDASIKAPRTLIPLIALGAEKFRGLVPPRGQGGR